MDQRERERECVCVSERERVCECVCRCVRERLYRLSLTHLLVEDNGVCVRESV